MGDQRRVGGLMQGRLCSGIVACIGIAACNTSSSGPQGPALHSEIWIPAGTFVMGHDAIATSTIWDSDYVRAHRVTLPGFFIDEYAASNADYKICFNAGECPDEAAGWLGYTFKDPRLADYPFATLSSHEAAEAYCRWQGKRLPTEAEWERAARGPDSFDYPWGNSAPDCSKLHCDRPSAPAPFNHYYKVTDALADVSPEGVRGMLTGVLETVQDKYDFRYYFTAPTTNPQGPAHSSNGTYVARGNWHAEVSDLQHTTFDGREFPLPAWIRTHWGGFGTGIRCARSDSRAHVSDEFFARRQKMLQGKGGAE